MPINWSDVLKVAVPAGAAVGGAVIASKGAKAAANTQSQSAADALALQREIFNQQQQNVAPYLKAGNLGLQQLLRGLGIQTNAPAVHALNGSTSGGGNSTYSSPLLGNLRGGNAPSALKTGLNRALEFGGTGAAVGAEFGGPVGAAIGGAGGAVAGGVSAMFGKGRREENSLVPIQNQVSGEVDRITKAVDAARANGTLTQQDLSTAINTVQGLQKEFGMVAQDYGRAGPGGVATLAKYFDPMVQQWQGELGNLPGSSGNDTTGDTTAGSGTPADTGGIGFNDFNASFDPTKDPGYNPQFEGLNHPFTAADYTADPGAAFRQAEGQKGIERSGAAKGMTLSGAGLKAIDRYNQDYASNEFQNAYSRFATERNQGLNEYGQAYGRFTNDQTNKFNRLAAVAGIGQTANSQANQSGANFGSNATDLITGAGNAQAAGQAGSASAFGGAFNTIGNNISQQLTLRQILAAQAAQQRQSGYAPGSYYDGGTP